MTLQEAAEAVRDAKLLLDDTKDRARAALRGRRLADEARYWEEEQRVDRLEQRLTEALAMYFTINERLRAQGRAA